MTEHSDNLDSPYRSPKACDNQHLHPEQHYDWNGTVELAGSLTMEEVQEAKNLINSQLGWTGFVVFGAVVSGIFGIIALAAWRIGRNSPAIFGWNMPLVLVTVAFVLFGLMMVRLSIQDARNLKRDFELKQNRFAHQTVIANDTSLCVNSSKMETKYEWAAFGDCKIGENVTLVLINDASPMWLIFGKSLTHDNDDWSHFCHLVRKHIAST